MTHYPILMSDLSFADSRLVEAFKTIGENGGSISLIELNDAGIADAIEHCEASSFTCVYGFPIALWGIELRVVAGQKWQSIISISNATGKLAA